MMRVDRKGLHHVGDVNQRVPARGSPITVLVAHAYTDRGFCRHNKIYMTSQFLGCDATWIYSNLCEFHRLHTSYICFHLRALFFADLPLEQPEIYAGRQRTSNWLYPLQYA